MPQKLSGFSVHRTNTKGKFSFSQGSEKRVADLYNSATDGSTDFTLHISNETELVITILGYAGLVIKDPQVLQAATQIGQAGTISKSQQ